MRIENWCGHDIRFVEINGHWYAILKDICDALKLKTWHISERLDPSMIEKVLVETSDLTSVETMSNTHEPVKKINKAMIGNDISRKRGERKTMWMLAVNEKGIYKSLFASPKLEARNIKMLHFDVMEKIHRGLRIKG